MLYGQCVQCDVRALVLVFVTAQFSEIITVWIFEQFYESNFDNEITSTDVYSCMCVCLIGMNSTTDNEHKNKQKKFFFS